jgi:hypothetical protein
MTNNIYFEVYWIDNKKEKKDGLTVQLPHEDGISPGDRIKDFTSAARDLKLPEGLRLRTEMFVSPPPDTDPKPLSDYLWADGTCNLERFKRHILTMLNGKELHQFLPHPGVPVQGPDLIGREHKVSELLEKIKKGLSCHLRAPRRYGKTSLLMQLKDDCKNAVFIEISDVGSTTGFLKALLRGAMRHKAGYTCFAGLKEYRSWPGPENSPDAETFNNAFNDLIQDESVSINRMIMNTFMALADGGMVLLIDEFSVFLREMQEKNKEELIGFLKILKEIRTREKRPLPCIFAGSSGLTTYIEFYGLKEFFNDLESVDIPPINEQEARILAEELFYGMGKLPGLPVIDQVVTLTGKKDSIPYFIHALAHETSAEAGTRKALREIDVQNAYYDRLLGSTGNTFFRDFLLREKAYPKPCRPCASAVLKALSCGFPKAFPEKELRAMFTQECEYEKLVTCLEEDYDLVKSEGSYRMRSKVLADRWRLGEPWLTQGAE